MKVGRRKNHKTYVTKNQLALENILISFLWRLGRRLYMRSRFELVDAKDQQNEYFLIEKFIKIYGSERITCFDIGAHEGHWSGEFLRQRAKCKPGNLSLRMIEPVSYLHAKLAENFSSYEDCIVDKLAFSNRTGNGKFYVDDESAGNNSLTQKPGSAIELVSLSAFDDYLENNDIRESLFVKSDAEGHDFDILLGATKTLQRGQVEVWQFEYSHHWINQRAFLKNVFDFISDKPYRLGKICNKKIVLYQRWHSELERFFEANYVLVKVGSPLERFCCEGDINYQNLLQFDLAKAL